MFSNYIKTALRNIMRQKLFSFINIVGLAVGLAAFILIMLFVRDETSWDTHWEHGEDIYRLETTLTFPTGEDRLSPRAVDPLKDIFLDVYPEVEAITRTLSFGLTARQGGELVSQRVMFTDPGFTDFFDFEFLEGIKEGALSRPENIVISARTAERYFGEASALDQTITVSIRGQFREFRVAGVIADPVDNTHLNHDFLIPIQREYFEGIRWFTQDWRFAVWETYVRFQTGTNVDVIRASLPGLVERFRPTAAGDQQDGNSGMKLHLVPIADTHLYSHRANGDASALYGFSAVAFLILLIAIANFLNLSMARTAHRAREVAMRKVVGAGRMQIIQQFLSEAILLALISLLFALVMVEMSLPYYNAFLASVIELDIFGGSGASIAVLLLALGVGISAGSFQAFYFSVLKPKDVLYSSTSSDNGTSKLRFGLVVAQFTISVALMSGAYFVNKQTEYVRSIDLGFNPDGLIVVARTNDQLSETIKQRLLESPVITAVGRSSDVPTEGSEDRLRMRPVSGREPVVLDGLPTGPDFFRAYEIPLLAGRYLTLAEGDVLRRRGGDGSYQPAVNIVVNRAGASLLGFANPIEALNQTVPTNLTAERYLDATIVGVVEDFHFDSARSVIRPGIYYVDEARQSDMSVRFDGAYRDAAISHLETVWQEIYPDQTLAYREMSDLVDRQYQTDTRLGEMLAAFTILAVTISCMGLFGLASFTVERRTREIGLRKVLGAGISDIISLLLWQFSKPILIATAIAVPVALYFTSSWLDGFVYRINIEVMPFAFISIAALMIGWVTVASHAFRIARAKPVKALRYE